MTYVTFVLAPKHWFNELRQYIYDMGVLPRLSADQVEVEFRPSHA